ncbi:KRTAP10-8: Keratin-associated protein 10-8 [Crotalus adamanteus]|uniref:KRTAP10-8: Keratin-associated protein 10-8 n=1 Tax=Crotalus adamanteus TaxID=8729 RepID=A0AAW1ANE4_CROAD
MSYGWNHCYPNCTPVTVTLQPPPFTMNIPSTSLCCPEQYVCVDPCRPCSPSVCSPVACSPTVCAPSMCAPSVCASSMCAPSVCGPSPCGPAPCGPASCSPASYGPMVCGPGLNRNRFSSCYTSCSLPSRKCLPRVQSICDPCTKY